MGLAEARGESDGYQGSVLWRPYSVPLNPKDNTDCSLGMIGALLFHNKEQKVRHIFETPARNHNRFSGPGGIVGRTLLLLIMFLECMSL